MNRSHSTDLASEGPDSQANSKRRNLDKTLERTASESSAAQITYLPTLHIPKTEGVNIAGDQK